MRANNTPARRRQLRNCDATAIPILEAAHSCTIHVAEVAKEFGHEADVSTPAGDHIILFVDRGGSTVTNDDSITVPFVRLGENAIEQSGVDVFVSGLGDLLSTCGSLQAPDS